MMTGLTRRLRAVRALVRLELRELRRHGGRSCLVLLLVAVPVAAVVGAAVLVRITFPTDEERRLAEMGTAALRVTLPFEYAEVERLRALLPKGSRTQAVRLGAEPVEVPGRRLQARAIAFQPGDAPATEARPVGIASGLFLLRAGRAPVNPGEVALSPDLLRGLDRSIGQTVVLEFGAAREITGVVVDPESIDTALVVRTTAAVEHRGTGYLLVEIPGGAGAETVVERLREAGFEATARGEVTGEGSEVAWGVFVLGSIGFLEAGLVVAATFIVGLRRRQYEIGLLGSTGATSAGVATSILVSTGVLALVAGCVGTVVGIVAAAAMFPFLDGWNGRLNGGFEIAWGMVLPAVLMGVVVALLSTVLPSWRAARLSMRVALGGRRPAAGGSVTWLVLGLATVGLGLMLVIFAPRDQAAMGALAAIGGSVLGVLGFGICSPFLLDALGRRASRLPIQWRLAMRDAGRFRARNGPVVTAVLAGMSMSVTVAVLVSSLNSAIAALPSRYRTDQLLISGAGAAETVAKLVEDRPGVSAAPLQAVYVHGEPVRASAGEPIPGGASRQWIAAADEDLLRAVGAEAGLEALAAGRLLHLRGPQEGSLLAVVRLEREPAPEIQLSTWRDQGALDPIPVTHIDLDQNVLGPSFALHRSVIERLGWEVGPPLDRSVTPWLVRLDRPVRDEDLSWARSAADASIGVTVDAQQFHQNPARAVYQVVQWLCILTGLIIVLVATALSAVESAADARVLHTIGAAPRLLRGHEAARAGYLAFLGCLLAIPAGLIPARVLFEASNLPLEVVVPWFDLGVALFALPLLAYAVTWLMYRDQDRGRWVRDRVLGGTLGLIPVLLGSVTLASGTVVAAGASGPVGTRTAAVAPDIRWEPFVGEAFDGSPLPGELGRIRVPARHDEPDEATIELAFVRYRTRHPDPGPPVVYLAGGPGGSGVEMAGRMATHPQMRFLEQVDVIGLDQRGVGLSRLAPESPAPPARRLPFDRPLTRDRHVAELRRAAEAAVRTAQARGVDPGVLDTRESADDIDALRRALDLDRVITYGASYGSHLGIAHLRRHPRTVARAILSRVEGPDHTWKLPGTVHARLEALHRRVERNSRARALLPDLLGTVAALIDRLGRDPVTVRVPAEAWSPDPPDDAPQTVVLGAYDLRAYLSNALSSAAGTAEIPGNLIDFDAGRWDALVPTAVENRQVRLELMPWATDCASGATMGRLRRLQQERAEARYLLGDAILAPHFPETCDVCPGCDLGDAFRSTPRVDVPVLFVSGTLDVRTPPENVDEIGAGFSRHAHVLVENAGHESRELMSPEYRSLFQAFLRGEPVASTRVSLPSVPLGLPAGDPGAERAGE